MGPLITAWAHSILGPRHPVAWYVVCIAGCPSYMWMCVVKVAVELFHKWITRELAINYVSQCIISIAQSVVLLIINPSHACLDCNKPTTIIWQPCSMWKGRRKEGWMGFEGIKETKERIVQFRDGASILNESHSEMQGNYAMSFLASDKRMADPLHYMNNFHIGSNWKIPASISPLSLSMCSAE